MRGGPLPSWADPLTEDYAIVPSLSLTRPGWGWWPWWPRPLAWAVNVQCRDSVASANTVPPQRGWNRFGSWHFGPRWVWGAPTWAVTAGLRNGAPWRCRCPPGRCEGKRGVQRHFVPW